MIQTLKNMPFAVSLGAIIFANAFSTVHAGNGTPIDRSAKPLDIAVIGDVPYGDCALDKFPVLIDAINSDAKVRTVVHVGDIKSGDSTCDDEWFWDVHWSFYAFKDPLIYTPGDNEWTDCHRKSNGLYDPLERLDKLRDVFLIFPVRPWVAEKNL